MTLFGVGDTVLRFSLFLGVLVLMTLAETVLPRRGRRRPRSRRWFTNFSILASSFAAVSVMTLLVPVTALLAAMWAEAAEFGLLHQLDLPVWVDWLIAFVVLDFAIWAQHLVTHKVPVLWRFHRVHHADEDFDASTAVRFHPVEIMLSVFVKAGAAVALGAPPGAVVLFEALLNASAIFNHANLRLPGWADRLVRLVIVTPDMHRVHHSVIRRETDSNYGFALSIWDRLFRTYTDQPEAGHEQMKIGLTQWQDDQPSRLGWSLWLPFAAPPHPPASDGVKAPEISKS